MQVWCKNSCKQFLHVNLLINNFENLAQKECITLNINACTETTGGATKLAGGLLADLAEANCKEHLDVFMPQESAGEEKLQLKDGKMVPSGCWTNLQEWCNSSLLLCQN